MLATPRNPAWLVVVAVLAYVQRPLSYWLMLGRVGPQRFPYDRHGYGLLGDMVVLGALLLPLSGLLWWIVRRYHPGQHLLTAASTPARTALSALLLLLLGAPPPAQWGAVALLPVADTWPVLVSAAAWFLVAATLRAAAVDPPG